MWDCPDHTAFCRFRDRIGARTLAVMMNNVVEQAWKAGLVSDMLSITDATDVKAKVNTRRWKDDEENPGGKRGPDGNAKWGRKSESKPPFFGYKCAISEDKDRYPDDGERERYYRRKKKRGRVEAKFGERKTITDLIRHVITVSRK